MKKQFLIGVMALSLATGAGMAQPPGGGMRGNPEQTMNRQLEMMKERLSLTEDQEKQVKAILTSQMKKQRELMEEGFNEETRDKMMALRQESNGKIKKVLKGDQVEKFDKMQEEMRQRRGPGGPPPPPQN
jgi:protein CpxP